MYRCAITGTDNIHQYEELIKVFLPGTEFEIISREEIDGNQNAGSEPPEIFEFKGDKNLLKRQIYASLREYTGKSPKWGIVTGIRPVKMAGELLKTAASSTEVKDILERDFFMAPEKCELTIDTLEYQRQTVGLPSKKSLSMYIGIPFCPTRCLYCSFTSNQAAKAEIDRYITALMKEIDYAAEGIAKEGWSCESLYIGGGTPTSLDEGQLELLLDKLDKSFDMKSLGEYTVEAGRPDTITDAKLRIFKSYGVNRISINPQSMKQSTLDLIGRRHTVEDVLKAFEVAKNAGIEVINTDLIAGLPEESFDDFSSSLAKILALNADNITLHTLAVKRASRLKEMDDGYNYRNEDLREKMLSYALVTLKENGYKPYYLYRQKHTSGNTENIGFCRDDKVSVYNIRIMEEAQSILAMGAGGISKIYFPDENRLERIPNVSNYEIYIDRVDEMIGRKAKNFFGQSI